MSLLIGSNSNLIPTDMGHAVTTRSLLSNFNSDGAVRNGALSQGRFMQMTNIAGSLDTVNQFPNTVIKSAFKGNKTLLSAVEKATAAAGIGTISGIMGKVASIAGLGSLEKLTGGLGNISGVLNNIGGSAGSLVNNLVSTDKGSIIKSVTRLF